jgi:hypothetical protein
MSVTVEQLHGTRGRRERKREGQSISNVVNITSVKIEVTRMGTESC